MNLKSILIAVTLCLLLIVTKPVSASTLTLTITTNKQTYNAGETVIIQGNLTLDGSPAQDALIALEIDTEYRYYVFRTLQTDAIEGANWLVEITDLYSCDMYGNPQNSFMRGSTAYAKVVWKNNSNVSQSIMVAFYLQFSTGSPFQAFYNKVSTSANSSSYIIASFEISSTAPTGITTIYSSLYTDFPKNGGIPYCPEKNATFTITSTSSTGSQLSAYTLISTSSTSNFQVAITLPKLDVMLGNYTVYGSCKYGNESVLSTAQFRVILVGDVNEDMKVDMKDIGLAAKAYGSKPGDPNWDPRCDLNNDGKIDMKDIGIICKNYGNTGV
ncbi:MAG: dockerin type I domain-containing protein [Candidatus Bathyarchaeota archaeon]|nr:dockerin type I domain-containing protein [Candidatus Bathyarchaeota archaeon]